MIILVVFAVYCSAYAGYLMAYTRYSVTYTYGILSRTQDIQSHTQGIILRKLSISSHMRMVFYRIHGKLNRIRWELVCIRKASCDICVWYSIAYAVYCSAYDGVFDCIRNVIWHKHVRYSIAYVSYLIVYYIYI